MNSKFLGTFNTCICTVQQVSTLQIKLSDTIYKGHGTRKKAVYYTDFKITRTMYACLSINSKSNITAHQLYQLVLHVHTTHIKLRSKSEYKIYVQ